MWRSLKYCVTGQKKEIMYVCSSIPNNLCQAHLENSTPGYCHCGITGMYLLENFVDTLVLRFNIFTNSILCVEPSVILTMFKLFIELNLYS